jgi:predicted DNA-binding WGR domain protein
MRIATAVVAMLAETTIKLEARNPKANHLRKWNVELGQDLLGMWIADIEFGRIGSTGRRLRQVFPDQPRRGLRRRATAPARGSASHINAYDRQSKQSSC